jgi:hypothetical protein
MATSKAKATPDKMADKTDGQNLPPDWMMFPALNEAWTKSADETIAVMTERIVRYKALSISGAPAERSRARLIAQSYVQVHAVLQELNTAQKRAASAEHKVI